MSAAEIDAAGVVLVGWWILACYLAICLIPLAPAISRAWRVVSIAWVLRRDSVLCYDWRRALRAARRLA